MCAFVISVFVSDAINVFRGEYGVFSVLRKVSKESLTCEVV